MSAFRARLVKGLLLAAATHAAFGCGSDSDDAEDGGGPNGTGGTVNLNVGGSSASGDGLDGSYDGGTVPLTPEQIDDIADAACAGWSIEGENLPAVLQLVVDASSSMRDPAPGGGGASKWEVTRDALSDAVDSLPASTSAGVLYYPNRQAQIGNESQPTSQCVNTNALVEIGALGAAGSMQRDAIQSSLADAETQTSTPTHDAYKFALEESLVPYQTSSNRFMLLITDGAPTVALGCLGDAEGNLFSAPTQPIIDNITAARAEGIRTFIIGSPGSEAGFDGGGDMRPWLSQAAEAGGTSQPGCSHDGPDFCHLDMTQAPDFSAALVEGLGAITGQIVDACTFTIPDPPAGESIDADLTTLVVQTSSGGKLVKPDNSGACTEGWQLKDGKIVLCEASCNEVKQDPTATVLLTFGCTNDEVVPVE